MKAAYLIGCWQNREEQPGCQLFLSLPRVVEAVDRGRGKAETYVRCDYFAVRRQYEDLECHLLFDGLCCDRCIFRLHTPYVVFRVRSEKYYRSIPRPYVAADDGCESVVEGCGVRMLLRYVAECVSRLVTSRNIAGNLNHVVRNVIRVLCQCSSKCDLPVEVAIVRRVLGTNAVKSHKMPCCAADSPVKHVDGECDCRVRG